MCDGGVVVGGGDGGGPVCMLNLFNRIKLNRNNQSECTLYARGSCACGFVYVCNALAGRGVEGIWLRDSV